MRSPSGRFPNWELTHLVFPVLADGSFPGLNAVTLPLVRGAIILELRGTPRRLRVMGRWTRSVLHQPAVTVTGTFSVTGLCFCSSLCSCETHIITNTGK